jgi:molybdopterin converting factor small subunit
VATVRYFAAARAAAGRHEEQFDVGTLDELVSLLGARYGERLSLVLKACSYLVDGVACRDGTTALAVQSTVDILPPFAGG